MKGRHRRPNHRESTKAVIIALLKPSPLF